jgi:hypothetical protein
MTGTNTRPHLSRRTIVGLLVGTILAIVTAGIALATSGDVWHANVTVTAGYPQLPVQHLNGGNANGGEDLYVNGQVWNGSLTNQSTGESYRWVGNVDQMFAINPYFCCELLSSGSFTLTRAGGGIDGQTLCTGTLALGRDHHLLGAQGYYQGMLRFAAQPKRCPFAGTLQLVWGTDDGSQLDLEFLER